MNITIPATNKASWVKSRMILLRFCCFVHDKNNDTNRKRRKLDTITPQIPDIPNKPITKTKYIGTSNLSPGILIIKKDITNKNFITISFISFVCINNLLYLLGLYHFCLIECLENREYLTI